MPLQPGTTLGPYAITAKIGEGGMGEMYRARDTKLKCFLRFVTDVKPGRFMRIAVAVSLLSGCGGASAVDEEAQVLETLNAFVRAFENADLEAMEEAFSAESTSFPRSVMTDEIGDPIDAAAYKRVSGMPPGMRELVVRFRASADDPPYMDLNPTDLEIRVLGDAALATFHLESASGIGRRTFVLAKEAGNWKIVHLHPSNVIGNQ